MYIREIKSLSKHSFQAAARCLRQLVCTLLAYLMCTPLAYLPAGKAEPGARCKAPGSMPCRQCTRRLAAAKPRACA